MSLSHSSPSAADPQEPTYHNVPAWLEMQPVYGNGEAPGARSGRGPRAGLGGAGLAEAPGTPATQKLRGLERGT